MKTASARTGSPETTQATAATSIVAAGRRSRSGRRRAPAAPAPPPPVRPTAPDRRRRSAAVRNARSSNQLLVAAVPLRTLPPRCTVTGSGLAGQRGLVDDRFVAHHHPVDLDDLPRAHEHDFFVGADVIDRKLDQLVAAANQRRSLRALDALVSSRRLAGSPSPRARRRPRASAPRPRRPGIRRTASVLAIDMSSDLHRRRRRPRNSDRRYIPGERQEQHRRRHRRQQSQRSVGGPRPRARGRRLPPSERGSGNESCRVRTQPVEGSRLHRARSVSFRRRSG